MYVVYRSLPTKFSYFNLDGNIKIGRFPIRVLVNHK